VKQLLSRSTVVTATCAALVAAMTLPVAAVAADPWDPYGEGLKNTNASLGYPVFTNVDQAVPDSGVPFDASTSQLEKIYAEDLAAGAGTAPKKDFWVDRMLVRKGVQPDEPGGLSFNTSAPENINYDNNDVFFSRGRALYMEDSAAGLGFRGDVAYIDSLGDRPAYTLTASVDGRDVSLVEDTAQRHNAPSYWYSEFAGGGIRVAQTKFIDEQNVLVEWLRVTSSDGAQKRVVFTAASPLAVDIDGAELRGSFDAPKNVTTVQTRLSGSDFAAADGKLTREVTVGSTAVDVKLQMGFTTAEIPESTTAFERIAGQSPSDAFRTQTTGYNTWWADNVPYLETPSPELDKSLFYRWWLLRTNFLDANIPGNDYQFPTTIEGVFGQAYNNAIVLTVGMFIDDLKYFRDPTSAYGSWISAGEVARSAAYVDNPGNPNNWSASYANYISESAWESYRLHGGDSSIAAKLAEYAEDDIEGQLKTFDGNGNGLIEYTNPAWTGNDVDAVSFSWRGPDPWHSLAMDRPESAYLYSGAVAAAQAYRLAGNETAAQRMEAQAAKTKKSVLDVLWEDKRATPDESGFYGDMIKGSYAANGYGGTAGEKIPWKEVNMFYPYTVGLMPKPGDADFDEKYLKAFRLFVDSDEYSPFPFFTANQADAKARAQRDPGRVYSNNFSTINSTVMFRLLSSAIRDYPNDFLTSDYYKKLLSWNAWASYEKGDVTRQNENEFWAHGSAAGGGDIKYRSWIHQTQLGTTNFTVIEDAMGLQSRTDDKLEVSPIDIDWDHFAANNIRYHDRDVSIVWDAPGGERHYPDSPEGYSVYIDGARAFTLDSLQPAVYDPKTGQVQTDAQVLGSTTAELSAASDVRFAADAPVTGVLAKAGVVVDPASSSAANAAAGAQTRASFTASGTATAGAFFEPRGAVDGSTVNEPFWGTAGSPNASDWLEVDLGRAVPVDEARVFFYRSSTAATVSGYTAPSRFIVQYEKNGTWTSVGGQARTPQSPAGNLNLVRFAETTASKFRVLVYHAPGARTGIKEIQLRDTGVAFEPSQNAAPTVTLNRDSAAGSARVRYTGAVGDDGLPNGDLTQSWKVISRPSEQARVIFSDSGNANTTITLSEKGDYRLEFAASDGAATTTVPVNLSVADLPPGPDISGTAQASASYTAPWNRLAALQDGRTTSAEAPAQADLWGTFRDRARPAQDSVTYTWPTAQRVAGAGAWFWNDAAPGSGGGVVLPQSWNVEYLGADGAWRAVDAASYPVAARGETSRVAFTPVSTTSVRATFTASSGNGNNSALALSEFDAYTLTPDSVEPVAVRTPAGTAPQLPGTVTAVFPDGSRGVLPVEWEATSGSQFATPGQITVNGLLSGSAFAVTARVSVGDSSNEVSSFEPSAARTYTAVAPDLPRTAVAVFTGGTGARESRAVTWDAVDPARYAQTGTFEVRGTVEGTTVRPSVTVTVEEDPSGPTPAAPSATKATTSSAGVTVSWAAASGTPTITEYEATMSPLAGGAPVVVKARGDAREALFSGVAVGEYTVSVRARANQKWSASSTVPVSMTGRPTAPTTQLAPAKPDGRDGWYVSVPKLTVLSGGQALEKTATPSASYTAAWNSLSALKDGATTYSGGDQKAVWGSWADTRPARQTVEYTWATAKDLTASAVNFWSDSTAENVGTGVGLPRSWKLQYRDAQGAWTDVSGVTAYPVTAGAPAAVTFEKVSTTGLRLVLEARTNGATFAAVAVSEWTVTGADGGTTFQRLIGGNWQNLPTATAVIGTQNGTTPIRLRAVSTSGAVSDEAAVTAKVDVTAPVSSVVTDPVSGSAVSGSTVTARFAATDEGSGVAYTEYSLDQGATWVRATGVGVTFADVGSYAVQYRSVDVAGNVEAAKSVSVSVTASPVKVEATASTQKLGGKVYVVVAATNRSAVPVQIDVVTAYGKKTFTGVQPGKKVSVSVNSTRTSIPAGKATVTAAATIDGKKVTASVDASYGASN